MVAYRDRFANSSFRARTVVGPTMILAAPDQWEEIAKKELALNLANYIMLHGEFVKMDFDEHGAVMCEVEISVMKKEEVIRAVVATAREMRAMYDPFGRIYDYELPREVKG